MTTFAQSTTQAFEATQTGAFEPAMTLEPELADPAYSGVIDAWWQKTGRFGHFAGQGGLRLACAAFVQSDVASERGAVVVVNGRTESLLKYPEVAYDLWRNGYSVYLYDHRGQGLSDREPSTADDRERGHVERFDDYVDDLATFVRTWVAPARHRAHFLLSHSMGGAVAALWLETPDLERPSFCAAALLSPMLAITGPGGRPLWPMVSRVAKALSRLGIATWSAEPDGRYAALPFEGNPFTRSAIRYARWREAYERAPEVKLGAPTLGWLAEIGGAMDRACRDAARIELPVLLIVAGDDAIVHPSGVDTFAAALRAPPRRLTVAGARHELLIECDAARHPALGEVLRFFAAHRLAADSAP